MFAVATINGLERLDALRERWERLYELTPDASFTQTFGWFRAAAEARGGGTRVYVATAGGRMIGLWPMFLSVERTAFSRRRVLHAGGHEAPRLSPVGPHPTATAAMVARHLRSSGDWDAARLTEPADEAGASDYAAAFAAAGMRTTVRTEEPLGEIRLCRRWAEIVGDCDDRTRLAVYRTQHHADGREGFEFCRSRPGAGEGCLENIEEATRLLTTHSPADRRVLEVTIAEAHRQGAADVAVLRHRGRMVAAAIGVVSAGTLESLAAGVAVDAPPLTAVRFVMALLRDSAARGDRRFTFLATAGHPAVGWTKTWHPRTTVRVTAPGRIGTRLGRMMSRERAGA